MSYVDGFVIPIPKKNVAQYKKIASAAGKIWKEFGALSYMECMGDDLKSPGATSFKTLAKLKPDETVWFSFIVYKDKAHRDAVNKKVMKDPRMLKMMDPTNNPFDVKRMSYGGFKAVVDL